MFDMILKRMKSGTGLIVFGVEPDNVSVFSFLDKLKRELSDCYHVSILRKLSAIDDAAAMHRILVDVERARAKAWQRKPVIVSVITSLEALSAAKGDIFQDDLVIDRICVADTLVSLSRSDLLVVPNAQASLDILGYSGVPRTPIEQELSNAMDQLGLQYKEQVPIGRFTADFVVTKGDTSLVVEADGAAFHDAETDKQRDREILEDHKIKTLRFTGSEIYLDAAACAQDVENFLQALAAEERDYRYENLQQLDPSQQEAVMHGSNHARVLAPAGSGKTRVLVNRISYILNSGAKPGSLVAIAFNKKAAEQLEDRLVQLGIPVAKNLTDRTGVVVATFNALGYRLLMSNGFEGSLVTSDHGIRKLISSALRVAGIDIPKVRGYDNLERIIKQLARVARGLMNPNAEQLELAAHKSETLKVPFPPIYSAIRNAQAERRQITFDDQIFEALKLTMSQAVIRHELQRRVHYILVDEYQDLNKAQISLVRMLSGGGARVFGVGDDDQLIYSWREAKTQHLLEDFERFFPDTRTFALETNYRCAKRIVLPSQRLISHNKNRFPKIINPSPLAPDGYVIVRGFESLKEQSQLLVSFLQSQHKPDSCDWIDMAVLTRTKVQLIEVARSLDQANIPRSSLPKIPLFSAPIGQVLHRYLRIINSPDEASGEDLAIVINRPNRYTSNEFREKLSKEINPISILEDYVANAYPEDQKFRSDPVKKLLEDIRRLNGHVRDRTVYDTIKMVISTFGLAVINLDGQSGELDEADDESILEIIAEVSRSYQFFDEFLEHYERQIRIERGDEDEESQIDETRDKINREETVLTDVVALNTIHATKGKEWKSCFIFDARDTPSRGQQNSRTVSSENEEERRVFYVAMTRAMHALGITTRTTRPSPFLREAFLPRAVEENGIGPVNDELRRLMREYESLKAEKRKILAEIETLKKRVVYVRTDAYRKEQADAIQVCNREIQALVGEKKQWRDRVPDGFLKRVVVGGFSMSDISARVSEIQGRIDKFESEKCVLASRLEQWDGVVAHEVKTIEIDADANKSEMNRLDKKINNIGSSIVDCENTKNIFEIFSG